MKISHHLAVIFFSIYFRLPETIETLNKPQFQPLFMPSKKVWANILSGATVMERPICLHRKKKSSMLAEKWNFWKYQFCRAFRIWLVYNKCTLLHLRPAWIRFFLPQNRPTSNSIKTCFLARISNNNAVYFSCQILKAPNSNSLERRFVETSGFVSGGKLGPETLVK